MSGTEEVSKPEVKIKGRWAGFRIRIEKRGYPKGDMGEWGAPGRAKNDFSGEDVPGRDLFDPEDDHSC